MQRLLSIKRWSLYCTYRYTLLRHITRGVGIWNRSTAYPDSENCGVRHTVYDAEGYLGVYHAVRPVLRRM